MDRRLISIALRSLEVWLVIAAAESVHGALRAALLEPAIGGPAARRIAVFTGSLIVLAVAWLFRGRIGARSAGELLAVGAIWVALTVAFELVLGRVFMHLSWERIMSDYDLARGGLMPLGLIIMLLAPLITGGRGRKT